jgi:hypothetical protein
LVVGRNSTSLTSGLATSRYEVTMTTPESSVRDWVNAASLTRIDVVVIVTGPTVDHATVMSQLAAAGCAAPFLLLGAGVDARTAAAAEARVEVMSPPLAMPEIVAALDRLVAGGTTAPIAEQGAEAHRHADVSDPLQSFVGTGSDPQLPAQSAPDDSAATTESTPGTHERVIVLPDSVPSEPAKAYADTRNPAAHSLAAPTTTEGRSPGSARALASDAPLRLRDRLAASRDPLDYDRRAVDLARSLLPLTEDLPSTSGAAGAVLTRAMSVTGSDAGAVLLSDGLEWRVSAGAGLRPLEWRLQLHETHWVVETVARDNRVIIVDGSDAVRGRLSPMPLSSRSHLMVAPMGRAPGIIVLARDEPFQRTDIDKLGLIPVAAFEHVADSLHVRALARALDGLRDLP